MIAKLVVAGLLLGHGLIHAAYIGPRPPASAGGPPWPFDLEGSAVLIRLGADAGVARLLGTALVVLVVAGFALAALSALGIGPAGMWAAGVAIGAVASLATLVLFFHPWLVLGIAIDLLLLWAVLVAGWRPEGVAV